MPQATYQETKQLAKISKTMHGPRDGQCIGCIAQAQILTGCLSPTTDKAFCTSLRNKREARKRQNGSLHPHSADKSCRVSNTFKSQRSLP